MKILLPLPEGCATGRFVRRIKRFSVEIEHAGAVITAHCNNTGAMTGLLRPGAEVLFSPAHGKKRKLAYTLERIRIGAGADSFWAGVNTLHPNRMLRAAFLAGSLDFARGYGQISMEVPSGHSRMDAKITGPGRPDLWVECKNVTLVEDDVAAFPDAAGERARRHLLELIEIVARGGRAAMFYLVQRPDGRCFAPADYIDAEYARLFYAALERGVEAYAHESLLLETGSALGRSLPIAGASV